jgi:hypothetical protein
MVGILGLSRGQENHPKGVAWGKKDDSGLLRLSGMWLRREIGEIEHIEATIDMTRLQSYSSSHPRGLYIQASQFDLRNPGLKR